MLPTTRSLVMPVFRGCLTFFLAILLTGCGNLSYYLQAVEGQMTLLSNRRSLKSLLADPGTPPPLRQKLTTARDLRAFAVQTLKLPDQGSYSGYVDLKRPFATWVVFATPEFSLTPLQWCFPITGCLGYRGYFNKEGAERFTEQNRSQGLDVHLTGSPAYSTLGWFDDPLLSSYIQWPDTELAALIFHELAHEKYYLPDATDFNESYAEAVGELGVRHWLRSRKEGPTLTRFERRLQGKWRFRAWVVRTREKLNRLYASGLDAKRMRIEKKAILKQALAAVTRTGFRGYLKTKESKSAATNQLNNAKLASMHTYARWVPAFRALFEIHDQDWIRFHQAVAELGKQPPQERQDRLDILNRGGESVK